MLNMASLRTAAGSDARPSNRPRCRLVLTAIGIALASLAPSCPRFQQNGSGETSAAAGEVSVDLPIGSAASPPVQLIKLNRPKPPRRVTVVRAGSNLQQAIDSARPGDLLHLEAGATFTGPFTLRPKSGEGWIVIQSSALEQLPNPGTRVSPAHSRWMPVLEAAEGPVLQTEPGAHHYWFIGLEIRPRPGMFLHNLVQLGAEERSTGKLPHHIVFERCYVHGDPRMGARRGIALNSRATAVLDSHLSDFKEVGADSQAIAGWNGSGPFALVNNHLEAAGENVMFGGADPSIRDLIPSDIEIRRNHFFKPLSWRIGDRAYAGTAWTVKNLFELKNARRVLVDGNLFEHNWPHAQNGFAILFTVRNQDGGAPWSAVEDVTFTNNVVRHVAAGINTLGGDDLNRSGPTREILIRNNLFHDVGGNWGSGRLFQLLDGTDHVVIEHNTALHSDSFMVGGDNKPHRGFVFRNNIVQHQQYGLIGSGTGSGLPSLERYFPGAVMEGNAIVGGKPDRYPPGNFFPETLDEVRFVDPAGGNFRLAASSALRKAGTDGNDVGVDPEALLAARSVKQDRDVPAGDRAAFAQFLGGPPAASKPGVTKGGDSPSSSRDPLARSLFWGSVLLLAYVCLGYPLMVAGWAALKPRPWQRKSIEPNVSIVIAAHNEAAHIKEKVVNLLHLDYPANRLEILVGSDGSTDDTLERLRTFSGPRIRLFDFESRQGKPAVLNALVPKARGEIAVMADARQQFDSQALRPLVESFADPTVGAVSGELILTGNADSTAVGGGTGAYWKYEKFIRSRESRIDSTVGATGALYAIRRELFEPIPEDTILDDVLIPLRIVRRGYRVLFEPSARTYDRLPATAKEEFRRKVRTLAGNFQLFAREKWLFNPVRNRLWWQTISHKASRLLIPPLQLTALGANAALAGSSAFYQFTLLLQVAFYAGAAAGWVLQRRHKTFWPVTFPYMFCLLSWATTVGFMRCITGRQTVRWEKATASGSS